MWDNVVILRLTVHYGANDQNHTADPPMEHLDEMAMLLLYSRTANVINTVVTVGLCHNSRWGKIAEHKMHVCARALEKGNITTIPFVLVNYAEFYEFGGKIEVLPTTMIRYTAYIDGQERQSTGNSAELEGLGTGLL